MKWETNLSHEITNNYKLERTFVVSSVGNSNEDAKVLERFIIEKEKLCFELISVIPYTIGASSLGFGNVTIGSYILIFKNQSRKNK